MVNFHPNLEIHNIKRLILDESFFFFWLGKNFRSFKDSQSNLPI